MTTFSKKLLILLCLFVRQASSATRDLDNGRILVSQNNLETKEEEFFLLRDNGRLAFGQVDLMKNEYFYLVPKVGTSRQFKIGYFGAVDSTKPQGSNIKRFVMEVADGTVRLSLRNDPYFIQETSPAPNLDPAVNPGLDTSKILLLAPNEFDDFIVLEQTNGMYLISCQGLFLAKGQAGECSFIPLVLDGANVPDRFLFNLKPASKVYLGLADAAFAQLDKARADFDAQLQAAKEAKYNAMMEVAKTDVMNATDTDIAAKTQKLAQMYADSAELEEKVKQAKIDADALAQKAADIEALRQQEATRISAATGALRDQFPDFDLIGQTLAQLKTNPKYATLTDDQKRNLEEAKGKMDVLGTSKLDMAKRFAADATVIASNAARNFALANDKLKLEQKKALAVLAAERALNEARLQMDSIQDERLASLKENFEKQKTEVQAQINILTEQLAKVTAENDAMSAKLKELQDAQYKEQADKNAAIAKLSGLVYAKDLFTPGELISTDGMDLPTFRKKMAEAAAMGDSNVQAQLEAQYQSYSKLQLLQAGADQVVRLQKSKLELIDNMESQIKTIKQLDSTIASNNDQIKAAQAALENLKAASKTAKSGLMSEIVKSLSGLDQLPKAYLDLQDKFSADLDAISKQMADLKVSISKASDDVAAEKDPAAVATKIAARDALKNKITDLVKQRSDLSIKFQTDSITQISEMAKTFVTGSDYTKLKAQLDTQISSLTTSLASASGNDKENISAQIEAFKTQIRKARDDFMALLGTKLTKVISKSDAYTALVQKTLIDLAAQRDLINDSFTKIINKFTTDGQADDKISELKTQQEDALAKVGDQLKLSNDELGAIANLKKSVCDQLSKTQVTLSRLSAEEINDSINALQESKRNQTKEIIDQIEAKIQAMQKSSADQQAQINSAHEERMKAIQKDFDNASASNQAEINKLQANTEEKLKSGKALIDKMNNDLSKLRGEDAALLSRKIMNLQAQSDALGLQLAAEKQNTVDAIAKQLDAKKAMQEAQAKEVEERKQWIQASTKKTMEILQKLAEEAAGEQKNKLSEQLAQTAAGFDAEVKAAEAKSAAEVAALQAQIKAAEDAANAQQKALEKDIENADKRYNEQRQKKQQELQELLAQNRTAEAAKTQQELDASDSQHTLAINALKASLEEQIGKAKQAQLDFQAAAEKNLAMLQQRLIDVQGSANVLSLVSGETIGIAKLVGNDNPTHLTFDKGAVSWNDVTRFVGNCMFKINREANAAFSIRTVDGKNVLTMDLTDPNNPKFLFKPIVDGKIDNATQAFFLQKVDSPILMTQISTFQKDKFLNFDQNGFKLGSTGEDFKVNRFDNDKGTIEALLASSLADTTLKGTKYGLETADQFFVSTQVFSSQTKMKDFVYALEEYVSNRVENKLFNEAMASKLDSLRSKIEKFLALAQSGAGSQLVDKAILESISARAQMLDPVSFSGNEIVFIKVGQEYLTTQVEKAGSNNGLLMAQKHILDKSLAFKVVKPDSKVDAVAFVSADEKLILGVGGNGDMVVSPAKDISPANLFGYSGTRKAVILTNAGAVLSRAKVDGKNYVVSSKDQKAGFNFEIEVYSPESFEYVIVNKGLAAYSADNLSAKAIGEICADLKARLRDQKLSGAAKNMAINTLIKYLGHPVVNPASRELWAREIGLIVEFVIENLASDIPVELVDKLLTTVESVVLSDGQYILLNPTTEAEGSFVKAESAGLIASAGLHIKAFFRVVKVDQTGFGFMTYEGKYLTINDSPSVIVSDDVAIDGDTVVKKPVGNQIFRVSGTGNSIFIKPEGLQGVGETEGFLAVDKDDRLVCRQTVGTAKFFDEADVRAKFRLEIVSANSPKLAMAKGNFAAVPRSFFAALEEVENSNFSDDEKVTKAEAIIKDLYTTVLKTVTLANGTVDLVIKDEFMPLASIVEDPDKDVYSMTSALDLITKRIKFDAKLVKNGIKFSEVASAQLKSLADEFSLAQKSATPSSVLASGQTEDPFLVVARPNNTDKPLALFLDDLWTDKNSTEQGARIWHSYLTKVMALVYGNTFDDNSNLFGLDWQGRLLDGSDSFVLTKVAQAKQVGKISLFPTLFKNSAGVDFTKTYPLKVDAVVDENGREVSPETVEQQRINLGLNLYFDDKNTPRFSIVDSDVKISSVLPIDKKKQLLDVLNGIKASKAPIVTKNSSAVGVLNTVITALSKNINFIETGVAASIGERIVQIIDQVSMLNFQGKHAESEKLAATFVPAPNKKLVTPALIAKALAMDYTTKTAIYSDFLSVPQRNALKVVRDDNKAALAAQKAKAAAAAAAAKKAAAIAARPAPAKPAPAKPQAV